VAVLLSGGIDSTACVDLYLDIGRPPIGVFIDYGQPAATDERKSVDLITRYYSIPLLCCTWSSPSRKSPGFIQGRNAFLLTSALLEIPQQILLVALGIHSGTSYPDCSVEFLVRMQAVIDSSSKNGLQIAAPFINWTKSEIIDYCCYRKIPLEMTFSCEQGGKPCGECLSCRDRREIYAGASI